MSEIIVKNICKRIKKNVILDDISMTFNSGKIYGLRGKNGCGKTMLMRVISGLIFADSGKVTIDGKVLHKDIDIPPSIGVLIENPSFIGKYSGFENLELLACLSSTKEITKEDIEIALDRVGLGEERHKQFSKYSLGMKQKLGIANAILGEPDLIILDEPINALDEESVALIKQALLELKKKEKTIIVACHDKEELEYLSDHIYEMMNGRCIGETEV